MANGVILIDEPAVTDKRLDTEELTVGGLLVQRERMQIAGAAATDIAVVTAANGLQVDVTRLSALVTGSATIGAVTGPTADNAANPTLKLSVLPAVALAAAPTRTEGNVNPLRVTLAGDAVVTLDGEAVILGAGTAEIGKLAAGVANIGDVDVLTVPADPFGANADAASATGSVSAKLRFIAATGIPITSIAAGTTNIGDVDVLTVPADPFGVNADAASATGSISAKLRFIAATGIPVTSLPAVVAAGSIAHDSPTPGNPIVVAGSAQDNDDTAPPNRVSAEADVTRFATDRDGSIHVHPYGPQLWSYHENSSSALTDTAVHAAPGAGLSLYVTDIVISTGAATAFNVFFEEGASTVVLGPYYLEAVAGRGFAIHFNTPKKITANTGFNVTTSAAIAHSIDVTGFTAQG